MCPFKLFYEFTLFNLCWAKCFIISDVLKFLLYRLTSSVLFINTFPVKSGNRVL